MFVLVLLACAPGPAPVGLPATHSGGPPPVVDTAVADTAVDTDPPDTGGADTAPAPGDDTAAPPPGPCAAEPDPERPMDFASLMSRLEAQGCLAEDDITAAVAAVAGFSATQTVWCDEVYRLSSPDGIVFSGVPERVREHASVPDVLITPNGTQVLVFNDLTPGLFEATLRGDPARFWREGLVGVGGLGMLVDTGGGFVEAGLDLHLQAPMLVVDPDLAHRPAGDYRLATFEVPATSLDGEQWDPYATPKPHAFYRATSSAFTTFPGPVLVVASDSGLRGGADPTVLDIDGGEILFLGDWTIPLLGWTAPAGLYPPLGTLPDVLPGLPAAAPDAVVAPDGTYRLYYRDPAGGMVRLSTSTNGHTWTYVGPAVTADDLNNPSVARAPDGTWWLYYNVPDPVCVDSVTSG